MQPPTRYLVPDDRDFFAVYRRLPGPGHRAVQIAPRRARRDAARQLKPTRISSGSAASRMRARGWRAFAAGALALATTAVGTPQVAASLSAGRPHRFEVRVFRFVDRSRTIVLPDGRRVDRTVVTIVRYPSTGGPYPLVVFGHGFALTPATYATLLRAWASAGYVVAAPVFPLGNANAPGGPNESDLVNQPADMRLVITRLLALNTRAGGVLHGRIDPAPDRGRRALGRGGDRARRGLRQPLPRPAGSRGGHPLGRRNGRDEWVPPERSAASRHARHSRHHQRPRKHPGVLSARRAGPSSWCS